MCEAPSAGEQVQSTPNKLGIAQHPLFPMGGSGGSASWDPTYGPTVGDPIGFVDSGSHERTKRDAGSEVTGANVLLLPLFA